MRIGIDARPLIEKKTGIGYYLKYLLENILENDKINEYVLISDREIYFDKKDYRNLEFIIDDRSKVKKTLWYLFKMDKICKENNIDIFWGTQHVLPYGLKNIKKILTIHDLVAFDFKDTMNKYNRIINKIFIPQSIRKADKIIAVSNSTKDRILNHFKNLDKHKVKVIYEDVVIKKNIYIKDAFLEENNIERKKYIMFLGTIEPRKNIKTLVKAFEIINKNIDVKLVICGKYGWNCEEEKALIESNKENIVFLKYISDDEKQYLMKESFLFVMPSVYEGFGLPVLEAMRCNAVVLVADNTSLKEIVEEEYLRFETMDFNDLAFKILNLYNDSQLYSNALSYCNQRQADFNWDDIAKDYIDNITVWRK